jgi:hypothetical protein
MKKYFQILILIKIVPAFIFAQTNSIELPDFVITGSKSVSMPVIKKNIPDVLVNIKSSELDIDLTRESVPELKLSSPDILVNNVDTISESKSGLLKIGAGYYIQPVGDLYLNSGIEHVLVNLHLYGENIKDYEDFSRYNISGAEGKLNFFISPKSVIFPGAKLNFSGKYIKNNYRLFGSENPSRLRQNDISGTHLSFENYYSNNFNYSINFYANKLEMKSDSLQEIDMNIEPKFIFKWNGFKFFTSASFRTYKVYSDFSDYNYQQIYSGYAEINPVKNTTLKVGGEFYNFEHSNYFKPLAEISYQLSSQFLFTGRFNPYIKYYSHPDFINVNPYYLPDITNNVAENHKLFSEFSMLYDYGEKIQVKAFISYDNIDSLVFVDDYKLQKQTKVETLSDVWNLKAGVNTSLRTEILGNYYFNVQWQSLFNKSKIYLPGYPDLILNFIHDIAISKFVRLITKLNYSDGLYYQFNNKIKYPSQLNVNLGINYFINSDLNLFMNIDNLTNKKYFDYEYYKHKPLDILMGFEYQW